MSRYYIIRHDDFVFFCTASLNRAPRYPARFCSLQCFGRIRFRVTLPSRRHSSVRLHSGDSLGTGAACAASVAAHAHRMPCRLSGRPSYENKSQAGRIALAISASRSEVPDLCLSPIRSEGRWTSLHSIIRLAGVQPRKRALWRQGTLALTRGRDIQADLDWAAAISLALLLS